MHGFGSCQTLGKQLKILKIFKKYTVWIFSPFKEIIFKFPKIYGNIYGLKNFQKMHSFGNFRTSKKYTFWKYSNFWKSLLTKKKNESERKIDFQILFPIEIFKNYILRAPTLLYNNLDIIREEITWIKPSRPREAKRLPFLNEEHPVPEYRELGRIQRIQEALARVASTKGALLLNAFIYIYIKPRVCLYHTMKSIEIPKLTLLIKKITQQKIYIENVISFITILPFKTFHITAYYIQEILFLTLCQPKLVK